MIKERFAMFNSYVLSRQLDEPEIIGDMYNYQVTTKGILLDYSKNTLGIVEKSGDQALISEYKKLIDLKKRLAKLYNKKKLELRKNGININELELTANELEDQKAFGVDVEAAGQNPLLRAGLLLSGASNFLNYNEASKGNNGIVTAFEIKNMDFR